MAFASRSMSETERRYAQIKKEALAITWACEKFSMYILGKRVEIETDHKPLVPLVGSKHLDTLPPRVLRFQLRLARFDYSIKHTPGKHPYTADTLSRALTSSDGDTGLEELAEIAMDACITHLPASQERLHEYQKAQNADPLCSLMIKYCQSGWPNKQRIDEAIKPYWEARGELTLHDHLLLHGTHIVVPAAMQRETLMKIYQGHQGIQRYCHRARTSVWWPGWSKQIEELVKTCPNYVKNNAPRKETLISTTLPDYPWQKIGTDLFMLDGTTYLLAVDYFSRYPEAIKLTTATSQSVVKALTECYQSSKITLLEIRHPRSDSE